MTISRRSLLRAAGLGLLWRATALGGAGALVQRTPPAASAGPRSQRQLDLGTATAEVFRPHVGTTFRVEDNGRRLVDLELVDVPSASFDGTDTFSLRFRAPDSTGLHQATYSIRHAQLGAWSMFLVPLRAGDIEAVINHVVA